MYFICVYTYNTRYIDGPANEGTYAQEEKKGINDINYLHYFGTEIWNHYRENENGENLKREIYKELRSNRWIKKGKK